MVKYVQLPVAGINGYESEQSRTLYVKDKSNLRHNTFAIQFYLRHYRLLSIYQAKFEVHLQLIGASQKIMKALCILFPIRFD